MDPGRRLSQYAHTAWRTQDGGLAQSPVVLTQTTDGYIWIGTEHGIFRFDGVRFSLWPYANSEPKLDRGIVALLGSSDGSLWIGTETGLTRLKDGKLTIYAGSSSSGISEIIEDHTGTVWVGRYRVSDETGPLCRVAGSGLLCFGASDGVSMRYINTLVEDHVGDLWLGSPTFCRWTRSSCAKFFEKELEAKAHEEGVHSLVVSRDGSIWAGFDPDNGRMGLQHFAAGRWEPWLADGFDSAEINASALLEDRQGALWAGTPNHGIYRMFGGKVEHLGASDGLSSDLVRRLFEDHEGNIWVATDAGLDLFRDFPIASFSVREGLHASAVHSVVAADDGSVWEAAEGGLQVVRGNKVSQVEPVPGGTNLAAYGSFKDHTGRLWFGLGSQLISYEEGQFRTLKKPDGSDLIPSKGRIAALTETVDHELWALAAYTSPVQLLGIRHNSLVEQTPLTGLGSASSLSSDPSGGIWIGLYADKFARYRAGHLQVISLPADKDETRIHSVFSDSGDSVWIASDKGLFLWRKDTLKRLDTRNGLPCSNILSVIRDGHGEFWLDSDCGLIFIKASELARWEGRPEVRVNTRLLDVLDGMHPEAGLFQSHVAKAPDGRLWYTNAAGLSVVDPDHLLENKTLPPVYVEEVIADRVAYSPGEAVRLPALTRDIEINYTAPSFVTPQRVRFRYKLENYDEDWQEAGTRRQAFYTGLSPGNYRFKVIACNSSGLWNNTGALYSIVVQPAYYQTTLFRSACVVFAGGVLWLLYLYRLKKATAQIQERMGTRMEERERIARELHDTLLQGFQGLLLRFQAVMKTLPSNGPACQMMEEVLDRADEVLLEGRQSVKDLREQGMSSLDLSQAIAKCGEELQQDHTSRFSLVIVGEPRALSAVVFNEAYRILREALINAFQHAYSERIEVEITYSDSGLSCRVRDDGAGIDRAILLKGRAGHWGLSGMRERAKKIGAQVNIWSQIGAGTELELKIPARVAYLKKQKLSLWQTIKSAATQERRGQA